MQVYVGNVYLKYINKFSTDLIFFHKKEVQSRDHCWDRTSQKVTMIMIPCLDSLLFWYNNIVFLINKKSYLHIIILFYSFLLFTGPICCTNIRLRRPYLLGSRMNHWSWIASTRLEICRTPNLFMCSNIYSQSCLLWSSKNETVGAFRLIRNNLWNDASEI